MRAVHTGEAAGPRVPVLAGLSGLLMSDLRAVYGEAFGVPKTPGHVTVARGPVVIGPDSIWTDAAAHWPIVIVQRETSPGGPDLEGFKLADDLGVYQPDVPLLQWHVVCTECGQSVLCVNPGTGEPYQFDGGAMLAGILAHLRRSHPDVVAS